ncbi:MAG TPA: low affinity iron permease family protein [bacterium]|jgi:low affinity Fe/Cu permease
MHQVTHVIRPRGLFPRFARWAAHAAGHSAAFGLALLIIAAWAITGPLFHFSDTWQLVINTGTTIVTFLMVFLIQNTQNRDTIALQLKIDELIRSVEGAHNVLLDLEELTEEELEEIKKRYMELALKAREEIRKGRRDTGRPAVVLQAPEKPKR